MSVQSPGPLPEARPWNQPLRSRIIADDLLSTGMERSTLRHSTTDPQAETATPGWSHSIGELRKQLIDVSKRNRLINTPLGKKRGKHIEIVDERADEVFRTLIREARKMRFAPADPAEQEFKTEETFFVPIPDPPEARHVDLLLQTKLGPEAMHRRLLDLYRAASSAVEEQGVSSLYLAIGFLRWYESDASDLPRYAPLLLLPVDVVREGARSIFKLVARDEDLDANLSLDALLKSDFTLSLPAWPDSDVWIPSEYYRQVHDVIAIKDRWEVLPDAMQLGFYSFAKFLMWKELEHAAPAELAQKLLTDGFDSTPAILRPDENLDQRFASPRDLGHILDADASQTQVIAAASSNRDLVVQGPPGTGKSQTIANIIAVSVRAGLKVLFVAEKRAALDVVHARLEQCGLGPLCLEMHSTKARRKHIYNDIKESLALGRPNPGDPSRYEQVRAVRDQLNELSAQLHTVDPVTGDTPFNLMGRLAKLKAEGLPLPDFQLPDTATWNRKRSDAARFAVSELADLTREYGPELKHLWRGANRRLSPMDRQRLRGSLADTRSALQDMRHVLGLSRTALGIKREGGLQTVDVATSQLHAMANRPEGVGELLQSSTIRQHLQDVSRLVQRVHKVQSTQEELERVVTPGALDMDWQQVRLEVGARGKSLFRFLSGRYRSALAQLRAVIRLELPKGYDARLSLLDRMLALKAEKEAVRRRSPLGAQAFGLAWQEEDTDLSVIREALSWITAQVAVLKSTDALWLQLNTWPEKTDGPALLGRLESTRKTFQSRWDHIAELAGLDVHQAFAQDTLGRVPFDTIEQRLTDWEADPDGQATWIELHESALRAQEAGLGAIRDRLAAGSLLPDHAEATFDHVRAEAIWNRLTDEHPELAQSDGRKRSELVEKFKGLDKELLSLSAVEILSKHYESIPVGTKRNDGPSPR